MIGNLKHLSTTSVTSDVADVTFTGLDDDSIYVFYLTNVIPSNDAKYLRLNFTESGSPNSTTNYDYGAYFIRSNSSFADLHNQNQSGFNITNHTNGTAGNESTNAELFVMGHNRSNEYTMGIVNSANRDSSGNTYSTPTSMVFTVYSVVDGVKFFYNTNNISSGEFSLYKVLS